MEKKRRYVAQREGRDGGSRGWMGVNGMSGMMSGMMNGMSEREASEGRYGGLANDFYFGEGM